MTSPPPLFVVATITSPCARAFASHASSAFGFQHPATMLMTYVPPICVRTWPRFPAPDQEHEVAFEVVVCALKGDAASARNFDRDRDRTRAPLELLAQQLVQRARRASLDHDEVQRQTHRHQQRHEDDERAMRPFRRLPPTRDQERRRDLKLRSRLPNTRIEQARNVLTSPAPRRRARDRSPCVASRRASSHRRSPCSNAPR